MIKRFVVSLLLMFAALQAHAQWSVETGLTSAGGFATYEAALEYGKMCVEMGYCTNFRIWGPPAVAVVAQGPTAVATVGAAAATGTGAVVCAAGSVVVMVGLAAYCVYQDPTLLEGQKKTPTGYSGPLLCNQGYDSKGNVITTCFGTKF